MMKQKSWQSVRFAGVVVRNAQREAVIEEDSDQRYKDCTGERFRGKDRPLATRGFQ